MAWILNPVEISTTFNALSTLLNVPFTFPRPGRRMKTSSFPELTLLSVLIVSVKIYHPFDLLPRHPRSLTDPGVLRINWNVWVDALSKHGRRFTSEGELGRGNECAITEEDVMRMTEGQMDEYLDWSERMWARDEQRRGLPKQLLDMFPTGRLDGSVGAELSFDEESLVDQISTDASLAAVLGSMKMRTVVSSSSSDEPPETEKKKAIRRLGSFYKRYLRPSDLSTHPAAKKFYEVAASLLGISVAKLVVAVLQVERKLQVLVREEMRRERGLKKGNGDVGEDEDEDEDEDEEEKMNNRVRGGSGERSDEDMSFIKREPNSG